MKQRDYSQPLLQSSKNIQNREYLEDRNESSADESSSISSSEEEEHVNLKKSSRNSHEPIFVKRGQQFIGLKPNQAIDLMKASGTIEKTNLRKAVLKQQSGPGFLSNHPDISQKSSRVRRKS